MYKYFKINSLYFQTPVSLKLYFIITFTSFVFSAKSQKNASIYQSISDYKGYSIFYISKTLPKMEFNPLLDYYWYIENEIHFTKGAIGGKPLHGSFISYYLDNNLKEKGDYVYGLKCNDWTYWFPDGNIQKREQYKNGYLDGKYLIYNNKNQIIISGEYKKNKKNGVWQLYNNNGQMLNSYTWGNGILNGKFLRNDSVITINGNYKNGNLHGKYIIQKNNKIDTIIYFKKGKLIQQKSVSLEPIKIKDSKNKNIKSSTNDSIANKVTKDNWFYHIFHRKHLDKNDKTINPDIKNKKKSKNKNTDLHNTN